MVGKVLKELLTEAYDAWYNDLLTAETYKGLSELILDKATALLEQKIISAAEWDAIQDENESNLMLVDDIADI